MIKVTVVCLCMYVCGIDLGLGLSLSYFYYTSMYKSHATTLWFTFNPRVAHMGFVVDNVALIQGSDPTVWAFFCLLLFHQQFPTLIYQHWLVREACLRPQNHTAQSYNHPYN